MGDAGQVKRLVACLVALSMLAGCSGRDAPASAYRNWGDRLAVAFGLRDLGVVSPCTHKEHDQFGDSWARIPDEECYELDPPRRYKGLWRNAFEGSQFCPAPATECGDDTKGDVIWLGFSRRFKKPPGGPDLRATDIVEYPVYAVDLIGRRTAFKGRYGHMGGSDYELVVDKFVSVKLLGFQRERMEDEGDADQTGSRPGKT